MSLCTRVTVCLLAVLLISAPYIHTAQGVLYHFTDGNPLCFSEVVENMRETQITGVYEWYANPAYPASEVRLAISLTDGAGNKYYEKKLTEGDHPITILLKDTAAPGEQLICFTPASSFVATEDKPLLLRVELDQVQKKVSKEKQLEEVIRKRKQVDGLDVFTYRDAGGQMKDILQPRMYLEKIDDELRRMEMALDKLVADLTMTINRDSRMRETSESTFTRVWVCAVLLIAVISGVLWMEFSSLKSTLRKKKLV